MPVATTLANTNERFELKSAPPDGFVIVRRMTYGEKMNRQTMLTGKMQMEMSKNKNENNKMLMEMATEQVTLWEFANLVVEHNLTDEKEVKLNFKNVADVKRLDPIVGEEIQTYIDKLNAFEEDDDVKN